MEDPVGLGYYAETKIFLRLQPNRAPLKHNPLPKGHKDLEHNFAGSAHYPFAILLCTSPDCLAWRDDDTPVAFTVKRAYASFLKEEYDTPTTNNNSLHINSVLDLFSLPEDHLARKIKVITEVTPMVIWKRSIRSLWEQIQVRAAETLMTSRKPDSYSIHILQSLELNLRSQENLLKACHITQVTYPNPTIVFDAASRGNPGIVGASGLLIHPQQKWKLFFAEGMGSSSNNFAKFRGLIQGIQLAIENKILNISIFGDSQLVVKCVKGDWHPENMIIADLTEVARAFLSQIRYWEITHIFREANTIADQMSNLGADLSKNETYLSRHTLWIRHLLSAAGALILWPST
eukprot:Gb_36358 [translate_table: standard]